MPKRQRHNDSCLGYEVVFTEGNKSTPCCPHGPTLLFEKTRKDGERGRRFFACSACRDRKDCNFFQWEDEKVSEARVLAREAENRLKRPLFSQQQCIARFRQFISLPMDQKKFCGDCQTLLLPQEHSAHACHSCLSVSASELRRPSMLLRPLVDKKSNAQYLFTERTSRFLLETLVGMGFHKVLCVGTPSLHELIKLEKLETPKSKPMKSLLLDIDFRYAQFYSQDEFCHYNMFNHHFFDSEGSSAELQTFLREGDGEKVVMVADPPFGGLVRPLANSFSLMSRTWRTLQKTLTECNMDMPMIWIFPYFFEPRIVECFPKFSMLDYQVDYDNHSLYKHGKTGRKQSPVRLFTNINPSLFVLPKEEGYRFCAICKRYVSSLNKHCAKCKVCPSKDGRQWRHCSLCEKCVKPSWRHCESCSRCALPDHPCGKSSPEKMGCFNCASMDHKRNACPLKRNRSSKRRGKKNVSATCRPIKSKKTTIKQTVLK
ncbi:rRNA N6-adenosine-methyltransferase ZCCHC4 isoform X1 [Entelurus aequoreus]|uniref:rRNA N6-adenosine-methyltransferase ZCCHC4 isoform X1 n=1 Tax=Entelurus aequoreus TaxID=161455 RepID=UPI002B1E1D9F|nr:rRNA N6-adenosine-methyltransferase ZCCHC4 isoform X1 [Entelurus aequoreus]